MSSSTIANPLFDPLQFDHATPTPSRLHSSRGETLSRNDSASGSSSSNVGSASGQPSEEQSPTPGSSSFLSRTLRATPRPARDDGEGQEGTIDLFGDKRVSRVFGALNRSSLFGDDEGSTDEPPVRRPREKAQQDGGHSSRSSRFYGALGDGMDPTDYMRSASQTTESSRAHTPLPDRVNENESAEPSLNLLATLHRMQDSDIERYMRIFSGSANSSSSKRDVSLNENRSSSAVHSADDKGPEGEGAPSLSSTLELPDVSTPSEEMSLHAPPSSAGHQTTTRSFSTSTAAPQSAEAATVDLDQASSAQKDSDSLNFVRVLSSALSTALQSASDANAELDALIAQQERELDNKRREWEARESALRALCSQHGIKNGEVDRALMRASPLQQELDGRKTTGVSPTPVSTQSFLSPPVLAPTPSTVNPKSQERFVDPEPDALASGGLSALHESLQEAMLDDMERSPSTVAPTPPATMHPHLEQSASERSISPALSASRHRRSSSKSTTVTSRTRDTSPGAASARSSRSQRPMSVSSIPTSESTNASKSSATPPVSKPVGAAATAAATFSRAFWRTKKSPASSAASSLNAKPQDKPAQPNVTRLPSMFGFSASSADSGQQMSKGEAKTVKEKAGQSERPGAKTVELDFMLPSDAKPPTFASLARRDSDATRPAAELRSKQGRRTRVASEDSSGDEFEVYGGKGSLVPPRPVFSDIGSDILTPQLLTDRYGFVYDATPADIKLLREARKASSSAPACLTGIRVGMRARGMDDSDEEGLETDAEHGEDADIGHDDDAEEASADEGSQDVGDSEAQDVQEAGDTTAMVRRASTISSKTSPAPAMLTLDLPPSLDFTGLGTFDPNTDHSTASKSHIATGLTPLSEAKPVIEASVILAESSERGRLGPTSPSQELEFKMGGSTTTQACDAKTQGQELMVERNTARKRPPTGSQTVRKLLSQLQSMHDEQQAEQQAEWDAFLKRRKEQQLAAATAASQAANKSSNRMSRMFGSPSPALATSPSNLADADEEELIHGLVGIQRLGETKAGKEDWAALQRLCRAGIPLCYRGAIWKECSGATEMAEPGRYDELLGEHEGETNDCLTQIDLDVHRTMPTNIFFGGNGPGVPKLRRVLVAFSWYDPVCGYCQGMNNLAATLLLTLPNEEDAFWVLASIISKILPAEYYTSHLLVSQADQRVLVELVDEHLPKLADHMREIGVDLPAVTFAWFLSLYTDCLPVETLFRVWDILFVDGMVVLFRIAMAILSLSEKELLATSGPAAFYGHMHSLTSRLFSVDRLMKVACEDLVHTIKYSNILVRREKHVKDLRVELGLDSA